MPLVVTDVVAAVVASINVEVDFVLSFSVVDIIVVSSVLGKVVKLLVSSNSSGVVFRVVSSTFEVDSVVAFCVVAIVVVEVIFIFCPVVVKLLPSSVPGKVVCVGTLVVLSGILEPIVVELSDVSVVGCVVIVDVSAVVVCDVVTVDSVVAVVVVVVDTVGVVSVDASVEKEVVIPGRIVVGGSDVGGRISINIEI